jgi:G3E family GTPase
MRGSRTFDGIVVETTGLADPAPVAQTFFVDEDVRRKTRLDAIITVADAKYLLEQIDRAPEARSNSRSPTSFSSTRSILSMRAASQQSNVVSETSTHTQRFTEPSAVISILPK